MRRGRSTGCNQSQAQDLRRVFGLPGLRPFYRFCKDHRALAETINKAVDVAGCCTIDGATHAFKLAGGQFTALDYPGATYTDARGINNRGDITGVYRNAGNVFHGYLPRDGKFTPIDFPNAASTQACGVGPSGEVVGTYTGSGVTRGFHRNHDRNRDRRPR